jgi:SWI/SNF-related matrix-associated actin-dependent regulator of chromatin subfamily A3
VFTLFLCNRSTFSSLIHSDAAHLRILNIYGSPDMRDSLEPLLIWATPGQRGFPSQQASRSGRRDSVAVPIASTSGVGSSGRRRATEQVEQSEALRNAAELRDMLKNLERVDDEGRRNSLLDKLCLVEDILHLPLHPNPPGISNGELKVNLLKHQVIHHNPSSTHKINNQILESGIAMVC